MVRAFQLSQLHFRLQMHRAKPEHSVAAVLYNLQGTCFPKHHPLGLRLQNTSITSFAAAHVALPSCRHSATADTHSALDVALEYCCSRFFSPRCLVPYSHPQASPFAGKSSAAQPDINDASFTKLLAQKAGFDVQCSTA